MRRWIAVISGLLITGILADAQVVSGRITDNTGAPMAAASVYIQELHQGTTTNSEGYYEIALPAGTYTVCYQFLGTLR